MKITENISGYLKLVFLLLVLSISNVKALDHPTIWATDADKPRILDNISKYSWAANMATAMRTRVNSIKVIDKSNPAMLVNSFLAIPGSRAHCDALDRAIDASIIYYLYGETDYAQLAADILNYYAVALGVPDYKKCIFTGEGAFLESRTVYPRFAIAYDFIYNYVNLPSTTVYDKVSASRQPFNHAKAQQTCKNFADWVYNAGNTGTNWSLLEGAGALYNVLCITDDVVREQYFSKYWNGTSHHDGFNAFSLQRFKGDGMWPESHGYSRLPQKLSLVYMEVIDNAKPELNVITNNPKVIDGAFLFQEFRYPNMKEAPTWGDSRRESGGIENILIKILKTATRKNLPEFALRAETLLKQSYALAGYKPVIETSQYLDWDEPLKLLWGFNFDLTGKIPPYEYKTTATVDHAGIVFQRNINCIDSAMNGLAYYSGGNHFVHSHLSGLDLELYGAGYVMGGVGGDVDSPNDRGSDLNRNYYRIYAGHNTVIVNGTSKGRGAGSWKSDGLLWQNKTALQATEPKEFEKPLSPNYSFATQFLGDEVNNCHQQRTNAIIRTSPTTGYYVDLFRSKSLGENKFHDYVYHNIGDEIMLNNVDNSPLPLSPQTSRYTSIDVTYGSAVVKFPGWHYFTNVNTSTKTDNAVTGRVNLNLAIPRYMHLLVPEGRSREYSTADSPPVLEAAAGYDKKNARVFTMRQYGEAWNRPFVTIFEPSTNSVASVKSVSTLKNDTVTVGVKVVSVVADTTITDWVLSHDAVTGQSDLLSENISFKGRFGIVRLKSFGGKEILSLYIGEGESLRCGDKIITTDVSLRAFETYETVSAVTTLQKKSFQIYPTAANSKIFTIETGSMNDYTCTLYDMSNREFRLDSFVGSKSLNLTGFKSGVYLLKLQNERACLTQKLMIY